MELTAKTARQIIETVGSTGQPPEWGFQAFTVGLDPYLSILRDEYLGDYIAQGGSSFKEVVGIYGGGKTHFLYSVRDIAWAQNYAVAYVSLSAESSPFAKLELVFREIMRNLVPPLSREQELLSGYERGVGAIIKRWYSADYDEAQSAGLQGADLHDELRSRIEALAGIENLSFANAIKKAYLCLLDQESDEEFGVIMQWLTGEGHVAAHKKLGILQKIDQTTVWTMLRSLTQWLRRIDYKGLVLLFDEAERMTSLSTKQFSQHLSNLREMIDACGSSAFPAVLTLYAVPDEHFLDGKTEIYEALRQRLSTVFDVVNPTGVRISLDKVISEPLPFLLQVGDKLSGVFETAYGPLEPENRNATIKLIAKDASEKRFADEGYKRLFVQELIHGLHFLRQTGTVPSREDLK